MINPLSTYRIQFNKDFTFNNLKQALPYLVKLGVKSIYASPIFEAVKGSIHGYDIINPLRINPEIGTEAELRQLKKELAKNKMFWIQDIVPNHMAYDPSNEWIMDVLEKGQLSRFSSFFDINWNSKHDPGRLMVPFLGDSLQNAIEKKELKVTFVSGKLFLKYYESIYPVNHSSYIRLLKQFLPNKKELKNLDEQFSSSDVTKTDELYKQLYNSLQQNEASVTSAVDKLNENNHDILSIANEQFYRLCHWQETDWQINYRRFFTVNGLICLNIQNQQVFDKHHELILRLTKEGIFDGLRIDHIDGLFDPTEYLNRLRKEVGENVYIIIEKILEPGEQLPSYWPIQGTTGYDFLGMTNNLFTNTDAAKKFSGFYHRITHDRKTFDEHVHDKKSYILHEQMSGELENLYQLFVDLQLPERRQISAVHPDDIKYTIGEFLIECPVYRYYETKLPFSNDETTAIQNILKKLRRTTDEPGTVEILEYCFLKKPLEGDDEYNDKAAYYYKRCMQFAGPLMAKGVEDTLMYTFNKAMGHNEVGDSPASFGMQISEYHELMNQRLQQWPLSLNATSTHDTKRGEDARARLNVLTDYFEDWFRLVEEWQKINSPLKKNKVPDANDEYLVYQALIASHPMPGVDEPGFSDRLKSFLEKALREAKTHSNWTNPNIEYENGVKEFATNLLNHESAFWNSFEPFFTKVANAAIVTSLSQTLLKFTCPGIPDIYQGSELWDFSFVDPDNRRPVDFNYRKDLLNSTEDADVSYLWATRINGKIKQWLISVLLKLRAEYEKLLTEGEYLSLKLEGKYKDNLVAFARKDEDDVLVIVFPKSISTVMPLDDTDITTVNWQDTALHLPKNIAGVFNNLCTGEQIKNSKVINVNELFTHLPISILKGQISQRGTRAAGLLLHISSLPSAYAIGDMGPEAIRFVDLLRNTKQKFWQILPLNPTEAGQGYSPYSALSSRAGNPLFISPELLFKDGLLEQVAIDKLRTAPSTQVNFADAEKIRTEILQIAFEKFTSRKDNDLDEFEQFCKDESEWLGDYADYTLLKEINNKKPWYEWADEYRLRDEKALNQLSKEHNEELKKIKWIQYIFNKQWTEVKKYSNKNKIKLIGDLPFYVSCDSADVWAHKEIFEVDEAGKIITMAGVPPDAFSSDGQLWGMPVFKWDVLKSTNYKWWIDRIRRNRELVDLIRIDHFRAFADYWSVPSGEKSAKNGIWKEGPGSDFFNVVKEQLGELPFIAEDLGEVNERVFELRDAFQLPGMKVLQFAFGEDMPLSDYIPHNYTDNFVVYTGTHDNNTVKGWYSKEADPNTKKRIEQYLGAATSPEDIHIALSRLAYSSTARMVILPVPDVLGLGEEARMNKPASIDNNWSWRILPDQLYNPSMNNLLEWVWLFNR
jgi:malto-oligosyltrehalose synthase/4-alpha-glucanotransferase